MANKDNNISDKKGAKAAEEINDSSVKLQYHNFVGDRYRELQETERLVFQAIPAPMWAVKKGIQIAAVPAVAVAATHAPIVGPVVAGAVAKGTHLMHSGIHGIAADRITHHFTELASQVPEGWGRQSLFNTWASGRTRDMLAKTDMWARPLSGFASPILIGKGLIDTGKLAIGYAAKGIPVVVARPIVHTWKMTNYFIDRTKAWLAEMQHSVQQTIEKLQGRQTTMADTINPTPTPIEPDLDRRAEYARLLSEYHKDPDLSTFEQIENNIKDEPDLALVYDEHVVQQALREGKSVEEATQIIANGPSVTEMSQKNLQDVSPYLAETTNTALEHFNFENSSKEAEDSLLEDIVSPLDLRGIDTSRLVVFYNGDQIFGMKGAEIDRSVTQVNDKQMEDIKEALTNFKNFEGELKVKVGSRVVLHLKEGQKLVDTYNFAPEDKQRPEAQYSTKDQLNQEQAKSVDPRLEKVKQQGGNFELAEKLLQRVDQLSKSVSKNVVQKQPDKEPALASSEPEL